MPDADRAIFRQIELNHGAFKAYEPWIDKMRASDRLEISSPIQPDLSRLEWHNAAVNIWIGKLPKANRQ
jgi:hypothetical protein